uniref:Uncharacterized protein n=1 Tax=Neobodo designis TaxID=312471 RepID=A0A7S1R5U3_NEODS|mmetsp:Transcript_917/g.3106  ORF Transcript_917/g.3106 Transcript_917/m.3106 type:complete len:247 (+) Transcript_917:37-777(+)
MLSTYNDDVESATSVADAFDEHPAHAPALRSPSHPALDPGEPTAMSLTVRVTDGVLRSVAQGYAADGIVFDEDTCCLVCAACQRTLEAWQVAAHVELDSHLEAMDAGDGIVSDGVPIVLNGEPMLLDSSCIFPRTMFGAGRALFDDTLGCVMAPDITGAVDVQADHEYTVVEFAVPLSDPEAPIVSAKPPKPMKYFSAVPQHPNGKPKPTTAGPVLANFWSARAKHETAVKASAQRRARRLKGIRR